VTATSINRRAGLFPALVLAAGCVLLQALIGGRVLLFCFPGLCLVGAAALFGAATASRSKARPDLFCLAATLIFFGYLISRALASPEYFARLDLFSMVGALAVYGLIATVFTSTAVRSVIVGSFLCFAMVHVVVGLIQFSRGDNFMLIPFLQRTDYGQRASGFYVCPNHLAGLLEVLGIFGLSLTCWSRWPVWSKLLVAYATAGCYVGLVLTGSRGGYLSTMASLVAFGFFSLVLLRRARPGRWLEIGLIGLVASSVIVASAGFLVHRSGYLSQRAGNIIDTKNMRVELWRAAIKQWQLDPVFGTGSGTYRFYGRKFRAEEVQHDPVDVHNDYLHLLCEYGLVGLCGFFLFFSAHVRQGWRSLRRLGASAAGMEGPLLSDRRALLIGALSAVAAFVVHSMLDFNLHIPANAILLAFVFGIIANPDIHHRSEVPLPAWLTIIPRVFLALFGAFLVIQSGRLFVGEYYGERARVALRDEDPAASILLVNKALEYERKNPELFFYLGRALIATAHQSEQAGPDPTLYGRAIVAFSEARRLAPLDHTYPLDLAYAYDGVGRYAEAEGMYAVARSLDPRSQAIEQLYQFHLEQWQKEGSPAVP
jgi:O-antigen ligase